MGKVKYSTGIEYVSGALTKPKKKEGHTCGNYLIGTHRVAATTSKDCTRLYIGDADRYVRSTPVKPDELVARTRFAAVSRAVADRAQDISKITTDQAAFDAQKNTPGGYKTMKSYLWSLELAKYDQDHPNG